MAFWTLNSCLIPRPQGRRLPAVGATVRPKQPKIKNATPQALSLIGWRFSCLRSGAPLRNRTVDLLLTHGDALPTELKGPVFTCPQQRYSVKASRRREWLAHLPTPESLPHFGCPGAGLGAAGTAGGQTGRRADGAAPSGAVGGEFGGQQGAVGLDGQVDVSRRHVARPGRPAPRGRDHRSWTAARPGVRRLRGDLLGVVHAGYGTFSGLVSAWLRGTGGVT